MEARTTSSSEPLIGAREVAAWLGLAVSSIYAKAATGEISHVLLWKGSRKPLVRFRRTEIERWLREHSSAPARD